MSYPHTLNRVNEALVIQIIARDIATGVEMARSLGYKMPASFDIGFKVIHCEDLKDGQKTRVRLRLDDATYDSILVLPYLNGLQSMPVVDRLWKAAMARLRIDANTMAHIWLDKHPDTKSTVQLEAALAKLDSLKDDDELADAFRECTERTKRFKYEVRR